MRLHLRRNFNEVFGRGNQFRLFCLCLPQKIFQFLPVVKMMIGKIEGFDRFYSVFAQRIIKFFRAADAGKGDNFVGSQRRRFGNDFCFKYRQFFQSSNQIRAVFADNDGSLCAFEAGGKIFP